MSKMSFAVAIHNKKLVIEGVTSIVPNLNGILLQTEDRHGYQIEAHEMEDHIQLGIEYLDDSMEIPDDYKYLDYREER
jgi:hypothetical protein